MRRGYASIVIAGTCALVVGGAAASVAQALPNHQVTRSEVAGGVKLTAEPTVQAPEGSGEVVNGNTFSLTKSVASHQVAEGQPVTYVHSVTNTGSGTAANVLENDSDIVSTAVADGRLTFLDFEFIEVPYGASATLLFEIDFNNSIFRLIATVDPLGPGETFSWKVRFRVNAPVGTTVSNQSTLQENCTQDPCMTPVVTLSDDPAVPGAQDPTVITVVPPFFVPALGPIALAVSAGGLIYLGMRRLRRRAR